MLFERKGVSRYCIVEEEIWDKIANDQWPVGFQLPSEPELAESFGVSRSTVRQAIANLAERGVLEKKHGVGTFVTKPSFEGDYIRNFFPPEMGDYHEVSSINHLIGDLSIARKLQVPADTVITEICRLRYIKDESEPAILEKAYYSKELFPNLEEENLSGKFYDLLEMKYNVVLTKAKTVIEPVLLNDSEAILLNHDKTKPVILLSRICYTYQDKVVAFTKSLISTDKCKLSVVDKITHSQGGPT